MARSKSKPQVVLRPQDLVVLLRLALEHGPAPTYATLANELEMTASEAHAAVERAVAAQLAHKDAGGKATVILAALRAFVQHGARYCFPVVRGSLPRAYSPELYNQKCPVVFEHVYESYPERNAAVYA